MPVRLIEALATTEQFADTFSDDSILRAMLQFELALAKVEARAGVIPKAAAKAIARAARPEKFDSENLARDAFRAGTLAIPFVKQLTEIVRRGNADAAGYVHWGATSQDVVDTALVLLLKLAQRIIAGDLVRLEASLSEMSERHKNTVMLGRTLLQPASPITFGLKAAGWLAGIRRASRRLDDAFREAFVLQFGGASGTLAALGRSGPRVARALAKELDLDLPEAPWHTERDRLANLACACGVVTAALGKMAADIALMMQFEVGEVSEPGGEGRGGSSTMPHKQNPIGCALTLAAAKRTPQLVAAFLSCVPQEHERAVGGWQSEWPTMASLIQAAGTASASMAEVAAGLKVDPKRMRQNIESTQGVVFAEKAMMLLAQKTGKGKAHQLIQSAAKKSLTNRMSLTAVLAEMPEVSRYLDPFAVKRLDDPENYLGCAEQFRRAQVRHRKASRKEI